MMPARVCHATPHLSLKQKVGMVCVREICLANRIPLEFQTKKVVLVAVPGAFTPTCQEQHVTSYLANLEQFKAKGVDNIIFIAMNDPFVMSAWGKANGVKDESIVRPLSGALHHAMNWPQTWFC
jgi:alkyl hydroperoxide reductase 1